MHVLVVCIKQPQHPLENISKAPLKEKTDGLFLKQDLISKEKESKIIKNNFFKYFNNIFFGRGEPCTFNHRLLMARYRVFIKYCVFFS